MVSLRHLGHVHPGIADLVGPYHRRALGLHLRQAGLGDLSAPRRVRVHAIDRLYQHDSVPSRRWRRPLGAAGTTRRGKPAAAAIPEAGKVERLNDLTRETQPSITV